MDITWVSLVVDKYRIKSCLSDGSFSHVYKVFHLEDNTPLILKVAKSRGYKSVASSNQVPTIDKRVYRERRFHTESNIFCSLGISEVLPNANKLISIQYQQLAQNAPEHPGIIRPVELCDAAGLKYMRMPFIEGHDFRHEMRFAKKSELIDKLIAVARTVSELKKQAPNKFLYHGDLKPENIMVRSQYGKRKSMPGRLPILLDPGYFGYIKTEIDVDMFCMITTPAYYPLLEPDDLLALGIMLWEIVFDKHPLLVFTDKDMVDPLVFIERDLTRIGDELRDFVEDRENISLFEFSPILNLHFPRVLNSSITSRDEEILLKAMRLKRTKENKLELTEGFNSIEEFVDVVSSFRSY